MGNRKSLIFALRLILLVAVSSLYGCATTTPNGKSEVTPDPYEHTNRIFYSINDKLDRTIMQPVARSYVEVTPGIIRTGVTNFFDNLHYPNVILNTFLQGKLKQGVQDTSRFIFNSTLGIGGLLDIATGIGLPKHNEDLGQTLAVWGFKSGAYLYIPLIKGPSTVRDTTDLATSTLLDPLTYLSSIVLWPVEALNVINKRANLLNDTSLRDEAAVDPYSFTREAYIQRRKYLIHDGKLPTEGYDDIFNDNSSEDQPKLIIK